MLVSRKSRKKSGFIRLLYFQLLCYVASSFFRESNKQNKKIWRANVTNKQKNKKRELFLHPERVEEERVYQTFIFFNRCTAWLLPFFRISRQKEKVRKSNATNQSLRHTHAPLYSCCPVPPRFLFIFFPV